jgi:hypothetical protein
MMRDNEITERAKILSNFANAVHQFIALRERRALKKIRDNIESVKSEMLAVSHKLSPIYSEKSSKEDAKDTVVKTNQPKLKLMVTLPSSSSLQCSSSLFKSLAESFLIDNRDKDPDLRKKYDERYGLVVVPTLKK